MSSVYTSMSGIIAMSDIVIMSHIGIMSGINGRFFYSSKSFNTFSVVASLGARRIWFCIRLKKVICRFA